MSSDTFDMVYCFLIIYVMALLFGIFVEGKENAKSVFVMVTSIMFGLALLFIAFVPAPKYLKEQGKKYELIVEDNKGNGGGY